MAKEEIVNGIKVALDKGQSLRDAMISFFNSGYKREDINDAAREVLSLTDSSGNKLYPNANKRDQNTANVPNPVNFPSRAQIPQGLSNSTSFQKQQNQFYPVPPQQQQNNFQQQNPFQQTSFGSQFPQNQFGYSQQNPSIQQRNAFSDQSQFQQNPFQQNFQRPVNPQQGFSQNNFSSSTPGFQNPMGNQQNSQFQTNMDAQRNPFQNPQPVQQNINNEQDKKEASVAPLPSPTIQKVSDYSSENKKSGGKGVLLFFLFFFLLLITGGIFGLVFFKDQIFTFFGI